MSHEIPMCAGLISMHLARHIADFDEPKLDLLEEAFRFRWMVKLGTETREAPSAKLSGRARMHAIKYSM